ERDGEVEARAGLPEIAGREVDDEGARRERRPTALERRAHAHAALLHASLREPHQLERGEPLAEQDLDRDREGLDAEEATRMDFRTHARPECSARSCASRRARPGERFAGWRK